MKKFLPLMLILILSQALWGHGMSEADKQAMVEGGNLRYLWLGAVHMVTGYDHLLFLFGVIFYLSGLKDIIRLVTLFTVGHSITLILATYAHITANYFLVDAVIALSVCYKAFDNLDGFRKHLKINPPPFLPMILVFGLIHGFGLSTRLQQLPLPEEGLLLRIISFNVGVELGQVAALSVLVTLLAGWRRTNSFRKLGGFANFLLLMAGVGLFTYQMTSYFRGDVHHDEKNHGAETGEHSHGGGEPVHDHGSVQPHSYGPKILDSIAATDSVQPATTGHTHEGHTHDGHGHTHDQVEGPKPKRPPKVPHTHGSGETHTH